MNTNLAFQDEEFQRSELVGGKVIMMSPAATNHVFISGNIYRLFSNYLHGKSCTPIADGVTVFLTDEDRFVPDFMVVCDRDKLRHDGVHGAPDLVVEVLSPSTVKRDRTRKKDVYGLCGVREYWLVNPADKSIEVYQNTGAELVLHGVYTLCPDWMLNLMTEKEKAEVVTQFKCSLFDELDISLEDIFSGLLPS